MASSQRPYQGYPYVNPPVIDAPSIDQTTASKWANLPRKQIHITGKKTDKQVIYIELPEDGPGTSAVVEEAETQERAAEEPRRSLPAKKEIDETPVVYIDMPENCNDAGQSRDDEAENDEPEFVQETIFYDPFEDRRIDTPDRSKVEESDSASDVSSVRSMRHPPPRPARLNILNLNTAGTSSYNSPSSNSSNIPSGSSIGATVPPMLSKETLVYGQTPLEDFSVAPIPASSFPEPPPAYTELDTTTTPVSIVEQPRLQTNASTSPPRTQVITPSSQNNNFIQGSPQAEHQIPIGIPNTDRKYLNCHHCGMRVHTLVIREVGAAAVITSLLCLIICMFPIIFLIYATNCLKNRNHYCPNCNKLIAYSPPCNSKNVVYVG